MKEVFSTTITSQHGEDGIANITEMAESTSTGQESSAEVRESAKGERSVTVKAYHADPMQAVDDAIAMYDRMLTHMRGPKK